jgi:hypothetical protein
VGVPETDPPSVPEGESSGEGSDLGRTCVQFFCSTWPCPSVTSQMTRRWS